MTRLNWKTCSEEDQIRGFYTLHLQKAYRIDECADLLGVSIPELKDWAESHQLPVLDYEENVSQTKRHSTVLTDDRTSRETLYMSIAKLVSARATCLSDQIGAVIVVDNRIVVTGYNGAPSGKFHCTSMGVCRKDLFGFKHWDESIPGQVGTAYEVSRSVHAEQSCIAQAAKRGIAVGGGSIYVTREPCVLCQRLLLNADVTDVIYLDKDKTTVHKLDLKGAML